MDALRSLAFNIAFYITTLFLALMTVPASLIFGAGAVRWLFRRWCGALRLLVRWILGGRIKVRGREHLTEGAPLLVSKHQSELDVAVMGELFPDYGAIAMRELDKYPLVGRIIEQLGHMKVTVDGPRQNQLPEVLRGARSVHDEGRPLLIYPEATLMALGRKMRYRSGVWHIYDMLKIPATPVAHDLGVIWPQRRWRKRVGARAAVQFLEPIPPGLPREEFLKLLENRIETATNALIREHADAETLAGVTFDYEEGRTTRAGETERTAS